MEPYKGLRPYEAQDKEIFFGRDVERNILIEKILTHKLTLLFAASGVGKSSLLQAAVIPQLKSVADKNIDVVYHKNWFALPEADLKQTLLDYFKQHHEISGVATLDTKLPLTRFFHAYTIFTHTSLVIILDQFEEFFNYQRQSQDFKPFLKQLATAILEHNIPTTLVISMREDFALELNAFKEYLPDATNKHFPSLLFQNCYRLEKLTREAAQRAIVTPLKQTAFFEYETDLLETMLSDLSRRQQFERINAESLVEVPDFIEPPHLQIVCTQLWQANKNNPDRQVTKATYDNLGGAMGLLTTYFETRIQHLSYQEQQLASLAFNYLVNKHGTKMAYPVGELAHLLGVEVSPLAQTLDKLEQARILRKQARQNVIWYELYHDMFAKSVYEWNETYKDQQSYCLRLSLHSEISDNIELYQGIRQPHYVYETGYSRADIEADKLFTQKKVPEFEQLNLELIGLQPLVKRIVAYYEAGEITKTLDLASAAISAYDLTFSNQVIDILVGFRSVASFQLLPARLQNETNTHLKRLLIAALAKIEAPFQIVPLLLSFLKDEDYVVRSSVATGLAHQDSLDTSEVMKPLVELLNDGSGGWFVCHSAISGLVQIGTPEVITPLLELLNDTDYDIRHSVVKGLTQIGAFKTVKAVTPLIELLLFDGDPDACRAADGLVQMNATEAVIPLIELLKDSRSFVRNIAATVLARMAAPEAVTPFLELLFDTDYQVRDSAMDGLVQINAPEMVTPLLELLKNTNKTVRYCATEVLAQKGISEAVTPLIDLLKDTKEYAGYHAAELLAQMGTEKVVKPLIELLKDSDWRISDNAEHGLTRIGTTEAVTLLLKLLIDSDPKIRCCAIDVLVQMGAPEAVSPLIGLLNDTDHDVQLHATYGLAQLGAVEAVMPLIDLLNNRNEKIRRNAAEKLALLGTVEAIKPLIESLKDLKQFVRRNAVKGLARMGALEAVKPLIDLLKDPSTFIRRSTALGLARMNAFEAVMPLIDLLKDEDQDVRSYAAKGLAQMGAIEAIKPFLELLNSNIDSYARDSAMEGLARLGVTKAVKPLIQLFNSAGKDVQWNVVSALNQLGCDHEEFLKKLAQEFEVLKKQSRHPSAYFRQQAAEKLGDFVSKESVSLLTPLLEDKNLFVKKQAIISLGQIGERQPALLRPLLPQLRRLTSDLSIHIRRDTITTLGKIVSQLPYGKKKWLTRFANLAKNQQELFIIRVVALKALAKLGTDEAAQLVLKMLSPEKIQPEEYSFVLTAFRALGDIRSKVALEFLRQQLEALTERKQAWRKQRDTKPAVQLNAWHESQLETELGYAIAQIEPKKAGIIMLYHDLAEVRKGAWLAIGSLGDVNIIKDLVEKHRESQVDEAHFRHAAFRAIDKSLITLEVNGNEPDLEKLKALLPNITDAGIKDRVEWTIYQLQTRIKQIGQP